MIAGVDVSGTAECSSVDISFNVPVNVTDASPASRGIDISFHLVLLGTSATDTSNQTLKEAASVPPENPAGLGSVILDPSSPRGATLEVAFAREMAFQIRRDSNSRHLHLLVASLAGAQKCLGVSLKAGDTGGPASGDVIGKTASAGDASSALAQGKTFLASGDFSRAATFFAKVVETGKDGEKQEAQELLGLAHERADQLPMAKAEYEAYLKLYPSGPGAARVKDRLAGVVAAMENQADAQFALRKAKQDGGTVQGSQTSQPPVGSQVASGAAPTVPSGVTVVGPSTPGLAVTGSGLTALAAAPKQDPHAWKTTKFGSFGQYYYRDDNFSPTVPFGSVLDDHKVFNNVILSTADGGYIVENDRDTFEAHASLFDEQGLGDEAYLSQLNVSQLYLDANLRDQNLRTRIGRQSRSTGGIFGRFDGINESWGIRDNTKIQAAFGSPVYSQDSSPFADDRFFAGLSIDYTSADKVWGGSLYAVGQNVAGIVDRRAIGGEGRYSGKKLTVYSALDYDLFFGEFNNTYVSGTWLPAEGTSIYFNADYRKSPFLLTSNALMGQQNYSSLQALVNDLGVDAVDQCARDRTSSASTVAGGLSQQLSQKWQGAIDASLSYYTGTPASLACVGGDPTDPTVIAKSQQFAMPDPGLNFYGSLQMTGTGIFLPLDTITGGLRYATSQSTDAYMIDGYYRYPISDKATMGPRVRLTDSINKTSNISTYTVAPSVKLTYRVNKNWNLESEVGVAWQDQVSTSGSAQMIDLTVSAGYRYDF